MKSRETLRDEIGNGLQKIGQHLELASRKLGAIEDSALMGNELAEVHHHISEALTEVFTTGREIRRFLGSPDKGD